MTEIGFGRNYRTGKGIRPSADLPDEVQSPALNRFLKDGVKGSIITLAAGIKSAQPLMVSLALRGEAIAARHFSVLSVPP